MLNELYLAVLYRPVAGKATGLSVAGDHEDATQTRAAELADALDACEKLAQIARRFAGALRTRAVAVLSGRSASGAPRSSNIWLC